ncbi:hypothetical protein DET54_102120 [Paenibacillus pabuli]|uniref:Uncharacterized protein n=1 Tax=Paenibacillus pabuli TaxID=1472 RepID=A0ABX9BPD4_9BACL|nr:hypothetical protein DET54_102120 [Paenibacillus pabuli]
MEQSRCIEIKMRIKIKIKIKIKMVKSLRNVGSYRFSYEPNISVRLLLLINLLILKQSRLSHRGEELMELLNV